MSIWSEIKDSYRHGTVLTRLIYINLAVFLIIRLSATFVAIATGSSIDAATYPPNLWFSVPSDPYLLIMKPWTIITYMFLQFDFFHILFNVLYLYWFGKLFMQFFSSRTLLAVYIYGGIAGAVFYILGMNLIPAFSSHFQGNIMMGASGSIMAILLAVASYAPNHKLYLMFIGEVRLKYVALVMVLIDLISFSAMVNVGGLLAHVGGAVFGIFYTLTLSKGYDISKPFSAVNFNPSALFKRKSKLQVTHKRPLTDMEYNANKVHRQKEVDRILEKIKRSGYNSLSSEEKKILFDASQEK